MALRILSLLLFFAWASADAADGNIRAVFDEADAALAIMETLKAGEPVRDEQWSALWQSEGYNRLLERQASMGRDEGFAKSSLCGCRTPQITVVSIPFARRWTAIARSSLTAQAIARQPTYPVM